MTVEIVGIFLAVPLGAQRSPFCITSLLTRGAGSRVNFREITVRLFGLGVYGDARYTQSGVVCTFFEIFVLTFGLIFLFRP